MNEQGILNKAVETIDVSKHVTIAERYTGYCSDEQKAQKLGEEVVELACAISNNDVENQKEEIGDCLFILIHLKQRLFPDTTLEELLEKASSKMVKRNDNTKISVVENLMGVIEYHESNNDYELPTETVRIYLHRIMEETQKERRLNESK